MVSPRRTSRVQVTLARALSKLGVASRTQAREMVLAGKVSVNGHPARDANLWLDPKVDRIAVEGRDVRAAVPVYLMMHKPRGVVTTRSDERGRQTVYGLLPASHSNLFPLGRLDKESSGLLLFTNDTRFGNAVTDPLEKIEKRYLVTLGRRLEEKDRSVMEHGMTLSDGTVLLPVGVKRLEGTMVQMALHEGKNRQIRRMCDDLGYDVRALHRVSIGSLVLGDLPEGKVRELSKDEVRGLVGGESRSGRTRSTGSFTEGHR